LVVTSGVRPDIAEIFASAGECNQKSSKSTHRVPTRSTRKNPAICNHASQRRWRFMLAAVIATVSSPSPASGVWGGSTGATSDYVSRGVTRSAGEPSVQADGHYLWSSGWFAGASAASVRRNSSSPTTAELTGYVGYTQSFTGVWSGRMTAAHYEYPGITPRRLYNYDELSSSLIYCDRLFLTVTVSPDQGTDSVRGTARNRTVLAYDLTLHQSLPLGLSTNWGVGYDDLHRLVGVGYVYWNAGLGYEIGTVHFDLSYIGADSTAQSLFYDNAATNRLVATVLWSF